MKSAPYSVDPWGDTRPVEMTASRPRRNAPRFPWQPAQTPVIKPANRRPAYRRSLGCTGCLPLLGAIVFLLALYLFVPLRTNLLLIGVDFTDPGVTAGRSDTIILATIVQLKPYIGLLSIPRDLWVNIPGGGENRINTAYFFAEASQPGSGPAALADTIRSNFGVSVRYYVRVHFDGFKEIIDAMGGVDIDLPEAMAGYEPGHYHLTSNKALAFVRHRYGEDDFFRMQHGQLLLKAAFKQMQNPLKWWRLPWVLAAVNHSLDTNLPLFLWPRLGLALLRAGPAGIDSYTITRQMASPYQTPAGADVLLPDWNAIRPFVKQIFSQ